MYLESLHALKIFEVIHFPYNISTYITNIYLSPITKILSYVCFVFVLLYLGIAASSSGGGGGQGLVARRHRQVGDQAGRWGIGQQTDRDRDKYGRNAGLRRGTKSLGIYAASIWHLNLKEVFINFDQRSRRNVKKIGRDKKDSTNFNMMKRSHFFWCVASL